MRPLASRFEITVLFFLCLVRSEMLQNDLRHVDNFLFMNMIDPLCSGHCWWYGGANSHSRSVLPKSVTVALIYNANVLLKVLLLLIFLFLFCLSCLYWILKCPFGGRHSTDSLCYTITNSLDHFNILCLWPNGYCLNNSTPSLSSKTNVHARQDL